LLAQGHYAMLPHQDSNTRPANRKSDALSIASPHLTQTTAKRRCRRLLWCTQQLMDMDDVGQFSIVALLAHNIDTLYNSHSTVTTANSSCYALSLPVQHRPQTTVMPSSVSGHGRCGFNSLLWLSWHMMSTQHITQMQQPSLHLFLKTFLFQKSYLDLII